MSSTPSLDSLAGRLPRKPVLKYYGYRALSTWHFVVPVLVLFEQSRGLSFVQISLLNGLFSAMLVVGEVPTGYVGDRIGRRQSLVVGNAMVAVSVVAFGLSHEFWQFVVEYLVWTLGLTFRSGSGDAWLYDVLAAEADEEAFARVRGRSSTVRLVVAAASTFLGGYLYAIDEFYPFAASGIVLAAGTVVLWTLPPAGGGDDDEDDPFTVFEAASVLREELLRPPLRSFLGYVAVMFAAISVTGLFVQPITVDVVGLPARRVGWIYAGATAAGAAFTYVTGTVKERVGIRRWFRVAPLFVGATLLAVVASPLAMLPAFVLARGLNRVTIPLRNQFVNDHVASEGRATVLSAVSMLFFGVQVPIEVASGRLADATSPVVGVGAVGVLLVVLSAAVLSVGVTDEVADPPTAGAGEDD